MPLTIQQVIQGHEALVTLLKNDKEEKFKIPFHARWVLAENLNRTIPVVEEFTKQHNALVAKYGSKQPDGNFSISDKSKEPVFQMERTNLLNSDSDIESFGAVNVVDFGADNIQIDLLALLIKTGMLSVTELTN